MTKILPCHLVLQTQLLVPQTLLPNIERQKEMWRTNLLEGVTGTAMYLHCLQGEIT